jgi:hypothetical protein
MATGGGGNNGLVKKLIYTIGASTENGKIN